MTQEGAKKTYYWLQAAFPKDYKTNASADFQATKIRQLYDMYREYTDQEVMVAVQKWAENNDKAPTIKNMLTELKWARAIKDNKHVDPTERFNMEFITDDGTEYMVMWNGKASFTLEEFMNIPRNKDHLTPDEWERRFRARRKKILYGHEG